MGDNKVSLVAKIKAAALAIGGRMKGDKRNKDQQYDYISADKALSELGQALFDAGVVVIPTITASVVTTAEYADNYGKAKRRFDAEVTFIMLLTDGEGDLSLPWRGMGTDYASPDKALYKAITSGHKYFLLKLLCIGEGNEDSEHETPEKPAARPVASGNGHEPPPEPPSMAEAAREELGAYVDDEGMTYEYAAAYKSSKGKRYDELPDDQLQWIISNDKTSDTQKEAASIVLASRKKN